MCTISFENVYDSIDDYPINSDNFCIKKVWQFATLLLIVEKLYKASLIFLMPILNRRILLSKV
ncbi:hypothetical protein B5J92_04190 [Moraxella atlantae]|nr:hypothetical protein B5J92_04190 [Moraxella atlantae]